MTEPNPVPSGVGVHPAPPPQPLVVAPKPPDADYGFVEHRAAKASTREELVARLGEGRPTPLVWTPETPGIVPPWTVPYLFEAYRRHGRRHSRKVALTWAAIGALLIGFAAVRGPFDIGNGFVIGGMLALVVAFYSALEWGKFRRLTPDRMVFKMAEERARLPARSDPARYTQAIGASIGLVMLVQIVAGVALHHGFPVLLQGASNDESIAAAGMVRTMVEAGEVWRLLSGAFLHGGLLHFGMNLMALLALGRFIEAYGHRAYVPLVFLLAGLAASTASYLGSNADASVGASGAILGLFGFLAVMARRRREFMPPGFGTAILTDISVIAGIGILGYGLIDNWAHGGGFASGALLGWLMIPRGGRTPYWEPSRPIRVLGDVALGILVLAGIGTAGVLVARLFFHAA